MKRTEVNGKNGRQRKKTTKKFDRGRGSGEYDWE
jgi:hypothetical protein